MGDACRRACTARLPRSGAALGSGPPDQRVATPLSRRRTSMRGTTRTVAVAAMSAVALLAAGCGSGDSDDTATSAAAGAKQGGEITVRGCNPENPLVPSNTTETCGGNVIDAVFSKLVHYDAETAEPKMDLAESIETTDN